MVVLVGASRVVILKRCCPAEMISAEMLFSFRDLWKEWGDSNFQIFTELPVLPQAAGDVG